ncbi:methyltransferase [Vibrio sinaloensis]|uniref:methyltransferase n=1 Tax=Photobacterium sp. (strain ATCC 43367) TaxID=379097 RepID=UPI0035EAEEEE
MQQHFQTLDALLIEHQSLWRFEPFFLCASDSLPWLDSYPHLCEWLDGLSAKEIEHLKSHPRELSQKLLALVPECQDIEALTHLKPLELTGLTLNRGVDTGVPGRKLAQIVSMGEAALRHHQGTEWLEWCSGKGFLGRILASQSSQKVTSFEFQQALCDAGQREADKQLLPMHFIQGDALSETAKVALNPNQHAVALHACGDLHVSLMKKAAEINLPALTISPCCYHLIQDQHYQPLSTLAKQSMLTLSKAELRIPLQETVTGGERVKRHRFEEMSFRLGFDQLLREQLTIDQYVPIPSIKKSMLGEGFEAFCRWAADKKQLQMPEVDFTYYQSVGERRYWDMEKLSLVQQLFRRSLELWLVLDKALFLIEQGYQVNLNEFCSKETTPRNILIRAQKS